MREVQSLGVSVKLVVVKRSVGGLLLHCSWLDLEVALVLAFKWHGADIALSKACVKDSWLFSLHFSLVLRHLE